MAGIKLVKGKDYYIVDEGSEHDVHLRSQGYAPATGKVAAPVATPVAAPVADVAADDAVEDTIEELAAASAPQPRKRR